MRITLIALATCMVAGLLAPAPARAAPGVARPGLLDEMGGDVVPLSCSIPRIRLGSVASLRSFHRAMAGCADRFWSARFAAAGLPYSPPEVTITTGDDSVCGSITGSGAQYCPDHRTIVIRIMEHDLRDPFRMNIAHSVAHEWGHHVQQLIGVLDAQAALYEPASDGARRLLSHRLEMQAECFAGVFYSATLKSIKPGISWEDWISAVRMADESDIHGKPRNLALWQDRGYKGGATGFCNTWTAAKGKVT
ncbi:MULTISPECIES: neutral zinc metallopeptidase [unclassified Nonomuraea]|uniref:neutral zinc metallopeptidase n=1 Tax=unclassified Nonomuraea TaxID=2593643 RepID=UPI0035C0E5F3